MGPVVFRFSLTSLVLVLSEKALRVSSNSLVMYTSPNDLFVSVLVCPNLPMGACLEGRPPWLVNNRTLLICESYGRLLLSQRSRLIVICRNWPAGACPYAQRSFL